MGGSSYTGFSLGGEEEKEQEEEEEDGMGIDKGVGWGLAWQLLPVCQDLRLVLV